MSRRHPPHGRTPACTVAEHGNPLGATPITTAEAALFHVRLALPQPFAAETIAMFTDAEYRPGICLIIEDSVDPQDVFPMAEMLIDVADGNGVSRLVLVSCRPGRRFEHDDVDRWFRLDHLFSDSDVELLEWFVCDEDTIVAASAVAGDTSRWPESSC